MDIYTERAYRSAYFDLAPVGIGMLHKTGRWLSANQALTEILGFTESELKARTFQAMVHPGDVQSYHAESRRMVRDADRDGCLLLGKLLTKHGGTVWAEVYLNAIRDSGELVGFAIFIIRLPQSGYKVEQTDAGLSIRPRMDWIQLITTNPKQSIFIILLALVALGAISVENVKELIGIFVKFGK